MRTLDDPFRAADAEIAAQVDYFRALGRNPTDAELETRRLLGFPPSVRCIAVWVQSEDEARAEAVCRSLSFETITRGAFRVCTRAQSQSGATKGLWNLPVRATSAYDQ
jgi:primosomal protein N'